MYTFVNKARRLKQSNPLPDAPAEMSKAREKLGMSAALPLEILLQIAKLLQPLDLLAFSLVCQSWCASSISATCRLQQIPFRVNALMPNSDKALASVAGLRRLTSLLAEAKRCDPFLARYAPHVEIGRIFLSKSLRDFDEDLPDAASAAVAAMTGVERLDLDLHVVRQHQKSQLDLFLNRIRPGCADVLSLKLHCPRSVHSEHTKGKEMEFEYSEDKQVHPIADLVSSIRALDHITLTSAAFDSSLAHALSTHTSITSAFLDLTIPFPRSMVSCADLLSHWPALRALHLRLDTNDSFALLLVIGQLATACPQLHTLHLVHPHHPPDLVSQPVLDALCSLGRPVPRRNLRSLVVDNLPQNHYATQLAELAFAFPDLEDLGLRGGKGSAGEGVEIGARWPKMRRIELSGEDIAAGFLDEVLALPEVEWVIVPRNMAGITNVEGWFKERNFTKGEPCMTVSDPNKGMATYMRGKTTIALNGWWWYGRWGVLPWGREAGAEFN